MIVLENYIKSIMLSSCGPKALAGLGLLVVSAANFLKILLSIAVMPQVST